MKVVPNQIPSSWWAVTRAYTEKQEFSSVSHGKSWSMACTESAVLQPHLHCRTNFVLHQTPQMTTTMLHQHSLDKVEKLQTCQHLEQQWLQFVQDLRRSPARRCSRAFPKIPECCCTGAATAIVCVITFKPSNWDQDLSLQGLKRTGHQFKKFRTASQNKWKQKTWIQGERQDENKDKVTQVS